MFRGEKNALLRLAASWGLMRTAEWLLAHGGEINTKDGFFLNTPLLLAVKRLNKRMAILLLKSGADPNVKDHWGISPLAWAFVSDVAKDEKWRSRRDRIEMMTLLIQHGAHVNDPSSPIGAAINKDDMDTVELLQAAGADWHQPLADGKTAAEILKEEGSPAMREKYLKFCEQK